jgi:hypothetical protein
VGERRVGHRFESCATHTSTEAAVTCPICGLPGPDHSTLRHQVVQERAADGYTACGCDPDEHDATGPCIRQAGHVGMCVGFALDGETELVQFGCRDDDSTPHAQAA